MFVPQNNHSKQHSVTLKQPKRHLYPVDVWATYFPGLKPKEFLEMGLPLVEFARDPPLAPVRGELIHAAEFNCPARCFRVSLPYRAHPLVILPVLC